MLLFLLLSFIMIVDSEVYVDPHDMDVKTLHKVKSPPSSSSLHNKEFSNKSDQPQCLSDMYFRRTLRLLLENAYITENQDNSDHYSGQININLNREDYEFLQIFAKNENTNDFVHVQSIVENAIRKPTIQQYADIVLTFHDKIKLVIFNPTTLLVFVVTICFIICWKLYYDKWAVFRLILIKLYAIDYILRYLQLIQLAEIEQMVTIKQHGHVPPECDPNKMDWREYFKQKMRGLFYEDSCREYYKASYQNLNYLITPLTVFANQLNIVIVEPLTHLGNGIGKFTNSLIGSLPLGYSLILGPIIILLVFIFLIMVVLFITNKALEFGFFGFHLRIGVTQPKIVHHNIPIVQQQLVRKQIKPKYPKPRNYKIKSIKSH